MDRERERSEAMVQRVTHNDRLLAIIVPRNFGEPGVNFITADDATLQLGLLNHPKSKIIQPHAHKVRPREVTVTQEVLFLRKGKLRVDFYDDDETYLESRILEQGDTILLVSGGHGFEVLEDVDIIEVKTGPYLGEDEKKHFGPARPAHLKITG